jgi:hypothetical protein
MMLLIWGFDKAEYFSRNDWTTQISLNRLTKFVCARTLFCAPVTPAAKRREEKSN